MNIGIYMKKITVILLFVSSLLQAEATFIIEESNASAFSIAVLPFINNTQVTNLAKVVSDDLMLSGQFKALDQEQLIERPKYANQIKYSTWSKLHADYLTIGSVKSSGPGRYELYVKLFSVVDQKQILALTLPVLAGDLRSGGHYVADKIYEKITGIKGIFSTKIAYVTATKLTEGIEYQLLVADADGKNAQALVTSKQPLLSPTWSPHGDKLAYVSFEKGNSAIYIQDLSTGGRELMSSFKGINSGPAFSPDGNKLAITLSKSGNAEVYLMDVYTKAIQKISNSWAIDTEAAWSPDGESIVFTSDRGGKPNLYQVNLETMDSKRITYEGDYNAGANFSPDGQYICFVQGNKNNYRIILRHNESETEQQISNGPLDESPTFAPNNKMILYATKNIKGQGILILTSLDGSTKNQLVVSNGHIKDPAWSPVIN